MKKIMIAAAIVCAAAMSQAAQIVWGNASTSKIVGLDGSTAITASNWSSYNITAQLMMVGAEGDSIFASASAPSSMSAGVIQNATQTYTYDTDATNGDKFYAILKMTVDGKDYQMIVDNNWAITASDNTGKDTFTWAAGTYGGLGTEGQKNVWVAQSVPEPTSGLLLLLGMAGLALKRKRA